MLLPTSRILLDAELQSSADKLQAQIIQKWFQDCKIDPSLGTKIRDPVQNQQCRNMGAVRLLRKDPLAVHHHR